MDIIRSSISRSGPEVFREIAVLKIWEKFRGNHPQQSVLFLCYRIYKIEQDGLRFGTLKMLNT